jgi:hypothetical protein
MGICSVGYRWQGTRSISDETPSEFFLLHLSIPDTESKWNDPLYRHPFRYAQVVGKPSFMLRNSIFIRYLLQRTTPPFDVTEQKPRIRKWAADPKRTGLMPGIDRIYHKMSKDE